MLELVLTRLKNVLRKNFFLVTMFNSHNLKASFLLKFRFFRNNLKVLSNLSAKAAPLGGRLCLSELFQVDKSLQFCLQILFHHNSLIFFKFYQKSFFLSEFFVFFSIEMSIRILRNHRLPLNNFLLNVWTINFSFKKIIAPCVIYVKKISIFVAFFFARPSITLFH